MIIVDSAGENSIVVAPGANGRVSAGRCRSAHEPAWPAPLSGAAIRDSPARGAAGHRSLAHELGVHGHAQSPRRPIAVPPDFVRGVYALIVNEIRGRALTGIEP